MGSSKVRYGGIHTANSIKYFARKRILRLLGKLGEILYTQTCGLVETRAWREELPATLEICVDFTTSFSSSQAERHVIKPNMS